MKKCIIAPDSFKGTMDAVTVCSVIAQEIRKVFPSCEIIQIPVADGGEGTVDCFLRSLGGMKRTVPVKGPYFEDREAFYGIFGDTAVIEMAAAAGLPLVTEKNPAATTTYGVGQLLKDALQQGCRNIVIGLGGSCTNDGACGMAAALDVKFYDKKGSRFVPVGGTLCEIDRIDITDCRAQLNGVKITAMCDINNPMFGPKGAAYVFAPQKGADEAMVEELDRGLRHLADVIEQSLQIPVAELEGDGAAGAMGAGCHAFFGAELKQGIEVVLDTVKFDRLLEGCDRVFTGEGCLDSQSLGGKVVTGICKRAKEAQIPVTAVVGALKLSKEDLRPYNIDSACETGSGRANFEEIKLHAEEDLRSRFSGWMQTFLL